MKKLLAALLAACLLIPQTGLASLAAGNAPASPEATLHAYHLTVSGLVDPVGLDDAQPLFSYRLRDEVTRGQFQTARRIVVSTDSTLADPVWDSGEVASGETLNIPYEGAPLLPRTRYYWHVAVTDKDGKTSVSDTAFFETGLLNEGWSGAEWITLPDPKTDAYFDMASFTLDFDMKLVTDAATILFGAEDASNFLMWQFAAYSWHAGLAVRPHTCTSGGYSCLATYKIDDSKTRMSDFTHITLAVNEGVIDTYLDGVKVYSLTRAPFKLGYLGFRRTDNEAFAVDNLAVKDADGNTVFFADFDENNADFDKAVASGGVLDFPSTLTGPVFLRKTLSTAEADSSPMFRKVFTVDPAKTVASARLYATACGVYDMQINGEAVTDSYLNPGSTAYDDHLLYQTFDVTELLRSGGNAVTATLGKGWFRGVLVTYGPKLALYAKLVVTYSDGSEQVTVTDGSWKAYRRGPLLYDHFYHGYRYDARREADIAGYTSAAFDDGAWERVGILAANRLISNGQTPAIIGQNLPLIKNTVVLDALSVTEPENGVYIYDLGQNIAGIVRIRAAAPAGTKMTVRYGELLNREGMSGATGAAGTLYTGNLTTAEATDFYIFRGDEAGEVFEPKLVYHGFRYIEITGLDAPPALEDVKGLLLMTDLEQTADFTSSDPLVDRLYQNAVWSARDNFLSIPTDCPQRAERYGWTGDAQIFARTGATMMDIDAFYRKYCMDMRDTAKAGRIIADVAPACPGSGWYGNSSHPEATNGWGDAIIIIPYQLYKQYGDTRVLEENYSIMCNWMDYLVETSDGFIRDQSWTGDWLPVDEPKSPVALTDTAFCAYSASLLAEIAGVLGHTADETRFAALYDNYRAAWQANFLADDGATTLCGTQTSYVLGLKFGLFDEDKRASAAQNLAANIRGRDYHLTTGFLGLSYLNPVLTENGYAGSAYRLLEQKNYPSWLYSVTTGSTTIWESWYALRVYEDGSSRASGESFNHFSYGAVAEWLYRTVLGIERDDTDPSAVAYKHFILQPTFGGSFTHAAGHYESPRGRIESAWTLDKDTGAFTYDATVPAGTTATLILPVADEETAVTESGLPAENADGVTFVRQDGKTRVYELASGDYHFETTADPAMHALTSLKITDPQGLAVLADSPSSFPHAVITTGAVALAVSSNDPRYAFHGFLENGGDLFAPGVSFTGDRDLALVFAYLTDDDGASGAKTLTVTGEPGTFVIAGGEEHPLPFTGTFPKGATVAVTVTKTVDGRELDSFENVKSAGNTAYITLNSDFTLAAVTRDERNREGYDLFFDFKEGIGSWRGSNAAVSHVGGDYMRFVAVRKSDGTYDPRAYYDFTENASTVSGGNFVRASDFDSLIVGYIADRVEGDSYPYLYISTEAQPSYINPVRGKRAERQITTGEADGATLREVAYRLDNWSAWTGNVKQIYLDILDNVDGDLRVDYIRLKHRDLVLTVKTSAFDAGTPYTFLPGASVDLTSLPVEDGFLGYYADKDFTAPLAGSFVLAADTTVYAKYDHLALPKAEWLFETDGDLEGFTVCNAASFSVSDGAFHAVLSPSASDFQMFVSGLALDASVFRYVVFDMKHDLPSDAFGAKPGEIFFRRTGDGWGQHLSAAFARESASEFYKTYIVDMSACSYWNGTVTVLRFDPFETVSPAEADYHVDIDSIRVVPGVTVTLDHGDGTEETLERPAFVVFDLAQIDAPVRGGWEFDGWRDENGDAVTAVTPESDLTLYAAWRKPKAVRFDFSRGTEGFTPVNGTLTEEDGFISLAHSSSNADVWLRGNDVSIDADTYRYAVVKARHNIPENARGAKPAEIFFTRTTDTPWQQHLSVSFTPAAASDAFVTYVTDMRRCSYWNGSVNRLRIDMFETASPSDATPYTVDYRSVAFFAAPCTDTQTEDGATFETTIVALPKGLTLVAAAYADGRLSAVKTFENVTAAAVTYTLAAPADTLKVFALAPGSLSPLCEAETVALS